MDLKAWALKIAPLLNSEESVEFMKTIDEAVKPESEVVKSLNGKIDTLTKSLQIKQAEIDAMNEEAKATKLDDAIEAIFEELKPKTDTMKALARKEIEDLISVDEKGEIIGIEDAKKKLKSEEYIPLFLEIETPEQAAREQEEHVEIGEKSKKVNEGKFKGLDFSKVANYSTGDTVYKSKGNGFSKEGGN